MPHSYCSNFIHCVFSTKGRVPIIPQTLQPKLWAYMTGTGSNLGSEVLAAGGMAEHVHLLFSLPAPQPLASVVQKLKANSSRWVREHGLDFEWQQGYFAVSVSPSGLESVKRYIRTQPEHHRRRSFEEEFLMLLKKCGVAYDPKFVFG